LEDGERSRGRFERRDDYALVAERRKSFSSLIYVLGDEINNLYRVNG